MAKTTAHPKYDDHSTNISTCEVVSRAQILSDEEDLELERQLKLINKPPVKSIQTEFGHIVDCIDINKQATFVHPLLKDHKIQIIPSFLRRATKKVDPSQTRPSVIGLAKGACPLGTVPIRRATKKDLKKSKLLLNNIHPQNKAPPGSYRASIEMKNTTRYFGVEGSMTVNNPQLKEGESYAQLYIYQGEGKNRNSIVTGWMVDPILYNDKSSHFFAAWTSTGFESTGCFNTFCPGFVQIHKTVYLGSPLSVGTVAGKPIFLGLSIQEDKNHNWWLLFTSAIVENHIVGYYPAEILFNSEDPRSIGWGGFVVGPPKGTSPPMGSGVLPVSTDASSFENINFRNEFNNTIIPIPIHYDIIKDNPKCYELLNEGYKADEVEFTFQFGGPGGQCAN
ncbi:hypothetical protein ACB098_11G139100 [Castanea mollissima]